MHTRSLELRVWRGARDDWPRAGTACGAAKVALRSLLTTLEGVDGDVAVTPEGGRGSGSVACHLFFKHRGVGSTDEDLGQRACHVRECEDGEVERQVPEPLREEAEVLVGREGPRDADGLDAVHGAGAAAVSGQILGWSESQFRTQEELKVQPSKLELSGGKLKVYVDRAMRLLSGTDEGTEPGASPELLPSTYVTFRWEEGGKPPLRSPLVLGPPAAGGADVGNPKAWQVRLASAWLSRSSGPFSCLELPPDHFVRSVSGFGPHAGNFGGLFIAADAPSSVVQVFLFYFLQHCDRIRFLICCSSEAKFFLTAPKSGVLFPASRPRSPCPVRRPRFPKKKNRGQVEFLFVLSNASVSATTVAVAAAASPSCALYSFLLPTTNAHS